MKRGFLSTRRDQTSQRQTGNVLQHAVTSSDTETCCNMSPIQNLPQQSTTPLPRLGKSAVNSLVSAEAKKDITASEMTNKLPKSDNSCESFMIRAKTAWSAETQVRSSNRSCSPKESRADPQLHRLESVASYTDDIKSEHGEVSEPTDLNQQMIFTAAVKPPKDTLQRSSENQHQQKDQRPTKSVHRRKQNKVIPVKEQVDTDGGVVSSKSTGESDGSTVPRPKQKETPVHLFLASSVSKNKSETNKSDTDAPLSQKEGTSSAQENRENKSDADNTSSGKNFFKGLLRKLRKALGKSPKSEGKHLPTDASAAEVSPSTTHSPPTKQKETPVHLFFTSSWTKSETTSTSNVGPTPSPPTPSPPPPRFNRRSPGPWLYFHGERAVRQLWWKSQPLRNLLRRHPIIGVCGLYFIFIVCALAVTL